MLLEDMLVIDAATLYPRYNRGGSLYAFDVIDRATIKPLIGEDGRSALVTFSIPGDDDAAKTRVDASLATTAAAQAAHPRLRVEQCGDASADQALDKAMGSDFSRAEKLSLPITLPVKACTLA